MSKFELAISENYVPNWTLVDAVREIFQNALDQQVENPDNNMFFRRDQSGAIMIGNKNSVLDSKTLLLGKTSKNGDDKTIGQFGEGYKIASLVLLRLGKTITFYNYGRREVWIPRLVKSRRYGGENILTFFVDRKFAWTTVPDNNLTICIKGISDEEYMDILKSNLNIQDDLGETIETDVGTILLDDEYKGKVFVSGLYVCDFRYEYGYNFKPQYIKLDRDRKMASDFELRWMASRMWSCAPAAYNYIILRLIEDNASDTEYVTSHTTTSKDIEISNAAYKKFTDQYGEDAVPVTTQDDANMYKGISSVKPVIVTEQYKKSIRSSSGFIEPSIYVSDPMGELKGWWINVRHHIPIDEQNNFRRIILDLLDCEVD